MRGLIPLALLISLAGCEDSSAVKGLSDFDLAKSQTECLDKKPTAPGRAQACKNIQRECERRRDELGLYICRLR